MKRFACSSAPVFALPGKPPAPMPEGQLAFREEALALTLDITFLLPASKPRSLKPSLQLHQSPCTRGAANRSQQPLTQHPPGPCRFSAKQAWVLAPAPDNRAVWQPCCDSTALSKPLCSPVSLSAAGIIMPLILVAVAFIFPAVTVHRRKIRIFEASLHYRLLKPTQFTTILPAAAAIGNPPPSSWEHHAHRRSLLLCSSTFGLYHLTLDENPQANNAILINAVILSLSLFL